MARAPRPTYADLVKVVRDLQRENEALKAQLFGIVDITVPYTVDHDIKAGHTIMVRIPKPFIPS